MSPTQGRLLLYLIENNGIANRNVIAKKLGKPLVTIARNLKTLEDSGYFRRSKDAYYAHRARGFCYTINIDLCKPYYEKINGVQLRVFGGHVIDTHSDTLNDMCIRPHSVSSSSKNNITTTNNPAHVLEIPDSEEAKILIQDAELFYWRDKGVNARQIGIWAEEFQMPVDQVIQSLKYCRYEMIVLNYEEEKQIRDPKAWFYKIMQRTGMYPRPANYKSLIELRAEQMEQEAQNAADSRKRLIEAEAHMAFQNLLSNQDGPAYQHLLSQADDFSKEVGGQALEISLQRIFFKSKGIPFDEKN